MRLATCGIAIALMIVATGASLVLAEAPKFGIEDGNDLRRGIRLFDRAADGQELNCLDQNQVSYALGFFSGALGDAVLWSKIDKACPFKLPEDKPISVEQLIRVTEKFLRENPKWLNEAPEFVVFLALKDAFPRQ